MRTTLRTLAPALTLLAILLAILPTATALLALEEGEETAEIFPDVILHLCRASLGDVVAELARLGGADITTPRDVESELEDYDFVEIRWDRILELVAVIHGLVGERTENGWTLREPSEDERPGLVRAAPGDLGSRSEILRLADVPPGQLLKLGDVPRTMTQLAPRWTRVTTGSVQLPARPR